ncbi:hypothetical protein P9112_008133 [Eukaryota sp. TZLM1-RC]
MNSELTRYAVSLVLAEWSTLNLVVKEGFAGSTERTQSALENLVLDVVAICSPTFKKDKETHLIGLLGEILNDDFNVDLEDEGELTIIARYILVVVDHAERSLTQPDQTVENNCFLKEKAACKFDDPLFPLIHCDEPDYSSSDSDEDKEEPKPKPSKPQKIVDDDGFVTVTK